MKKITPFLWYDNDAEEAMNYYMELFPDSEVYDVRRYGEGGPGEPGTVMTASFRLFDQDIMVLNGGPVFKHTEAFSFFVNCDDQAEVDRLWDKFLADGGEPSQCGWLKDKFGVSWQIIPKQMNELLGGEDPEKAQRAMNAMLKMVKIDVNELKRAYDGEN